MDWLRRLAVAESSLGVQLALVLIYAVFWSFALKRVGLMLQRWLKRQAFASNVIARSRRTMREGYGIYFDERAAFETTCTIGAVLSQHAAGGLAPGRRRAAGPARGWTGRGRNREAGLTVRSAADNPAQAAPATLR